MSSIHNGDVIVGKKPQPEALEVETKAAAKEKVLHKISTSSVSINEQLDFRIDPKEKKQFMEFAVLLTNNQHHDLVIELDDIQKIYATYLINQDKEKSLWSEVNTSEDRLPLLQAAAKSNAVPAQILVEQYNERLEREGRSSEKLETKSLESSTKIQHFSRELEKELDKISETLAEFQTKPSATMKTKKPSIARNPAKSFEPK